MHAVMEAAAMCDKLVIAIGSSQMGSTKRNPMPASMRIKIIKAAINASPGIGGKINFAEIPDFQDNEKWFSYIIKKVPKFDVVFSSNALVKSIFRGHKIKVVVPKWHDRKRLSGTNVRSLIRKYGRWQSLVPKGARDEIEAHNGAILSKIRKRTRSTTR